MFGYHDSDRCGFDIWSPVDDENGCAIENRAFSPYVKHEQELSDIVNSIVAQKEMGNLNFSLTVDDSFSEADINYIRQEVERRLS